eukprot:2958296-Pyramimonas_sp.AAC.1
MVSSVLRWQLWMSMYFGNCTSPPAGATGGEIVQPTALLTAEGWLTPSVPSQRPSNGDSTNGYFGQ